MKPPNTVAVAETCTIRPALASRLTGLSVHQLMNMATDTGEGTPFLRSVVIRGGTEYRLDDLLMLVGALGDAPW
jgi:hypothetical protein